jgi:hypothetical protein
MPTPSREACNAAVADPAERHKTDGQPAPKLPVVSHCKALV